MNASLQEVLAIVGRLDDAPGSDTPRERFRRFLMEHVGDVESARSVVEQCQRVLGEQYRRALQDTVVMLGRFLGFEVSFGHYERAEGSATLAGEWWSRHRLRVTIDVWTNQLPPPDVTAVVRALASNAERADTSPRIGLCIPSTLYASKAKLELAIEATGNASVRLLSLPRVVQLAQLTATGRLSHHDVLALLVPRHSLDGAVELVARLAERPHAEPGAPEPPREPDTPGPTVHDEPAFWVNVIRGSALLEDQPVGAILNRREILGVDLAAQPERHVRRDDMMCFFIPGYGSVAHARIADVLPHDGVGESRRFTHLIQLGELQPHEPPVRVDVEKRLDLELQAAVSHGSLVRVTRGEFLSMTAPAAERRRTTAELAGFR